MPPVESPQSIRAHDTYPGVIEVEDIRGARIHYLWDQGVYVPGLPFIDMSPDGRYQVHMFLPYEITVSRPTILMVKDTQGCMHTDSTLGDGVTRCLVCNPGLIQGETPKRGR